MSRCAYCSNRATTDRGLCESCAAADDFDAVYAKVLPVRDPREQHNKARSGPTRVSPDVVDAQYHGWAEMRT